MGMFDYVYCEHPLPGEPLELLDEFQTKCLDCTMAEIIITEGGKLTIRQTLNPLGCDVEKKIEYLDYTGTIEFYGSNCVASGPSGRYTKHGEDFESATFEATFEEGRLTNIEQTGYERKPCLSSKEMPPHDSYKKGSELEEDDSYLGQTLYVCWGGFGKAENRGYEAEVVYETDIQLCVKKGKGPRIHRPGELEILDRFQIGNTIYKSLEEAQADDDYRDKKIEEAKANYQRKLKEKEENE
jgi:hypothetical protein